MTSITKVSKEQMISLSNSLTKLSEDYIATSLISDLSCPTLLNPYLFLDTITHYGPMNQITIDEPTSDQESSNDIEIFDNLGTPTFKEFCNYFFDLKMLRVIESKDQFPSNAIPSILYPNIGKNMTVSKFLTSLKDKSIDQSFIKELRIFPLNDMNYALIKFDSLTHCEEAMTILNPYEGNLSLCYDGTDLKKSYWFPVVLRDLPMNITKEKVTESYCEEYAAQINQIVGPVIIGGVNSCLVIANSLEIAEKICNWIGINHEGEIKAHLHYRICKKRFNKEKSHFANCFGFIGNNGGNVSQPKIINGGGSKEGSKKKKQISSVIDMINKNEDDKERKLRLENKGNDNQSKEELNAASQKRIDKILEIIKANNIKRKTVIE